MNIHAPAGEAARAESTGNALYEKLLPALKKQGCESGLFVAINIETGEYVTAKTRRELMISYQQTFGRSIGWVRQIDNGKSS